MCDEQHHVFTWAGGNSNDEPCGDLPCVCGKTRYDGKPIEED